MSEKLVIGGPKFESPMPKDFSHDAYQKEIQEFIEDFGPDKKADNKEPETSDLVNGTPPEDLDQLLYTIHGGPLPKAPKSTKANTPPEPVGDKKDTAPAPASAPEPAPVPPAVAPASPEPKPASPEPDQKTAAPSGEPQAATNPDNPKPAKSVDGDLNILFPTSEPKDIAIQKDDKEGDKDDAKKGDDAVADKGDGEKGDEIDDNKNPESVKNTEVVGEDEKKMFIEEMFRRGFGYDSETKAFFRLDNKEQTDIHDDSGASESGSPDSGEQTKSEEREKWYTAIINWLKQKGAKLFGHSKREVIKDEATQEAHVNLPGIPKDSEDKDENVIRITDELTDEPESEPDNEPDNKPEDESEDKPGTEPDEKNRH